MKVLVIAAHPDDEILGCGGALLKHKEAGDIIDVCIVTRASDSKWSGEYRKNKIKEAGEVDSILGTNKRYYADFPSVKLNTIDSLTFNSKIGEIINESNPDLVYTHHESDINIDHRIIFDSVMVNTRPIEKRISVICFETFSSTEWNNKSFIPNYYIKINTNHLDGKIEMFGKYKSEVKQFPHPRSFKGIEILASKRGMDICYDYAEAFCVVRSYWI